MVIWFHVTSGYTHVEPEGIPVGHGTALTNFGATRCDCAAIGLGVDHAQRFVL